MTVQQIIDVVIRKTGLAPLPGNQTCDHLMTGSMDQEVHKIVTTFMATVDVIRKAIELGADMIITHEPTWFTGHDTTEWLQEDPVYLEKQRMISEAGLAIWRFHDHMHMAAEDGIYRGFDHKLGWKGYRLPDGPAEERFGANYVIPQVTLAELAKEFKQKLDMDVVQIVGDPNMTVRRVGVMVGGGALGLGVEERPMQVMRKKALDVAICGDIVEWTLSAYIRDAAALGMNKGMLVLGHERSEEMGMEFLGDWLKDVLGDMEIVFVDSKEPFKYL